MPPLLADPAPQLPPHLLQQAGHMLVAAIIDQLEGVQQSDLQAQEIEAGIERFEASSLAVA